MQPISDKPIIRRQGDVLTVVRPLPAKLTELPPDNDRVVLAHGEVTGHAHAFYAKRACLFRADDTGGGATFLTVGAGDDLEHEEHSTIHHPPLPDGMGYLVCRQVEYTPAALRNVAD